MNGDWHETADSMKLTEAVNMLAAQVIIDAEEWLNFSFHPTKTPLVPTL